MKVVADSIRLSATDLANYLGCRHLTELDRAVARGKLSKPDWFDPSLAILAKRGAQHEAEYVEFLRAKGLSVVALHGKPQEATVEAMKQGFDVIVQATLSDGNWMGNADILLKVKGKSNLGNWSYEVQDTKLSQNTRAATILQLCLYTDLLSRIQGLAPWKMYVVKPGKNFPTEDFLFTDFRAYYDLIRRNFERTIEYPPTGLYPDPVPHCDICRWWKRCDSQRHTDDHLSLIAGIRTLHRNELKRQGVETLEEYARLSDPLRSKPERGNIESYRSIHHQAKIQLEGRLKGKLLYDLLATDPGRGLYRLPEPNKGDIYFDIEGDPFFEEGGLEYLLGVTYRAENGIIEYAGRWGLNQMEEKRIFEDFIDFIIQRWSKNPSMYIYHYGIYEPAAVKRLTGRHGTRADEVDQLLRAERFIDLHAVIRESLKASVERYSLKDLEGFTDYRRKIDLPIAGASRRALESALELKELTSLQKETIRLVQDYNEDDCRATDALHQWLEKLRTEAVSSGMAIGRPEVKTGEAPEGVQELQTRAAALFRDLTRSLPENRDGWSDAEKAKWLLAHLIEYFRREDKSAWWEYFRVHELDHDELLMERKGLTGLKFQKQIFPGGRIKVPIHRYEYPPQEVSMDEGDELHVVKGDKLGTVHAIQLEEYTIDIKKMTRTADVHPAAVHVQDRVEIKALATSIMNLAESIIEDGIETEWPHRAAKHLLLKKRPRLLMDESETLLGAEEDVVDGAIRLALNLDKSILAIQGPPGSGKTYTGAKMIIALVRAGHKVGITAVSHKVIRNLFDKVIEFNKTENAVKGFVHKVSEKSEIVTEEIVEVTKSAEAIAALQARKVVGGTAWLWADDDSERALDYLFIDEAGQMSLSLALAASRAAKNLILLGDPQQLEQPQRGSHPEGSDVAALTYLLDGHKTIPPDKGLFLGVTRRLHPLICRFTSELFYEGRLNPLSGLERQEVRSSGRFNGAGLFYEPVEHWGNQDKSIEEVASVERIVKELTSPDTMWVDANGVLRQLQREDILIVAPYNAQVSALREKLTDMRIGTVDKFQGQEAPVVIYSMTSSSAEDSPRGMSFLYNPNRLNVATSRAKGMCILVASPRLLEPECHTVEQMRWANALCRFRDLALVP
jgi:predicted RecB family nuclease